MRTPAVSLSSVCPKESEASTSQHIILHGLRQRCARCLKLGLSIYAGHAIGLNEHLLASAQQQYAGKQKSQFFHHGLTSGLIISWDHLMPSFLR